MSSKDQGFGPRRRGGAADWPAIVGLLCTLACSSTPEASATSCDSCSGADDCYSLCVCQGAEHATCEGECSGAPPQYSTEPWTESWDDLAQSVIVLVNAERERGGCCGDECFEPSPALSPSEELTKSARLHALDMAERQYFAHDTPEQRTPFDRMRAQGFQGCALGENLAEGQASAEDAVSGWMASPDHCENILWPDFRTIGVGYAFKEGESLGPFWVQNFGD